MEYVRSASRTSESCYSTSIFDALQNDNSDNQASHLGERLLPVQQGHAVAVEFGETSSTTERLSTRKRERARTSQKPNAQWSTAHTGADELDGRQDSGVSQPEIQRQVRQQRADIDALYELVVRVDHKVDALDVSFHRRLTSPQSWTCR